MARKKRHVSVVLPKLFRRGKKGFYYFRRFVNGKDKWISTGTADQEEAKNTAEKIIKADMAVNAMSRLERSARKLADTFVEGITGKKNVSVKIADAFGKWLETIPHYKDISGQTRSFHKTIFSNFNSWSESNGHEYIDQIDNAEALKYARYLWETGISGKTYNEYISFLSRLFDAIDAIHPLPNRNPFDSKRVPRKKKSESDIAGHQPLEPEMLKAVMKAAAEDGQDYLDLFIIGSQTGMRLKDATLLKWKSINNDFIEIVPHKTRRSSNVARIPVSKVLNEMLERRKFSSGNSEYVVPEIAEHYLRNRDYVTKRSKSIFEEALGKENTQAKAGKHRKYNTSIYSFHSFRTTFMSLLAAEDVSTRDAMRIMGWESPEMIQVYEKMLEKAQGNADKRATELINKIDSLKIEIPQVQEKEPVRTLPNKETLVKLIAQYSNITIGKVYGVSSTAVRKWLDKYGLVRGKRIESADLSEKEIEALRKELMGK